MKLIVLCVFLLLVNVSVADERKLEAESNVVTEHRTTVKGEAFSYTATAGTQPVWDEDGEVIASLFYTYYQRSDVRNRSTRPLIISFNGGPGSASVWMHIAYTGPRILNVDDEGYRSGHMMYLRSEDLEAANEHIREFIQSSKPAAGEAAKY